MTDYRLMMSLLIQNMSYRQIESLATCSHATIAKAKKVCRDHNLTITTSQINELSAEDIDALFADGRKTSSAEFVAFDVTAMVKRRTGTNKPHCVSCGPTTSPPTRAPVNATTATNGSARSSATTSTSIDLTMRITHIPGHTMQVDWAGTKMAVFDPITGRKTKVSVFIATLPYSGMIFARGYLDEKSPNWLDAHQQAFEHFGGIAQVIIPDNASTASNQIARDVNATYRDFLEYHRTAAVPARVVKPQDKGNVEAGVKIVTSWVINRLADQRFSDLDELNDAVADHVTAINTRTPFRGQHISRRELFDEHERGELLGLPESRWEPVTWRKAKVNRDYHIEITTVKYSAPHPLPGARWT
ncbi:Mobile element protein [Corynebacterium casei]|uniref:IS21 family transposase n=1 Tax=Corynebacterium casei TaxID=160386 RepID=UPI0009CEF633|nr:IS21 family transposase [Corynebacterium casei]SLM93153.1 Mobile element protein [Corynebacterium casei]